eukprot:6141436-Alexandrium_andersonii.AAC.1
MSSDINALSLTCRCAWSATRAARARQHGPPLAIEEHEGVPRSSHEPPKTHSRAWLRHLDRRKTRSGLKAC